MRWARARGGSCPDDNPQGGPHPSGDNVPMTTDIDTALPAGNPFAAPPPPPHELPHFTAFRHDYLLPAALAHPAHQRPERETLPPDPTTPAVANTPAPARSVGH